MINDIMQQEAQPPPLAPMPYIHKMQGDKSTDGIYLVFPASGKPEMVAAATASEALEKSTVEKPVRVLRHDPLSQTLLQGHDFTFDEEAEETSEAAPEEAAEEAQPEAEEAPAEDAPAAEEPSE